MKALWHIAALLLGLLVTAPAAPAPTMATADEAVAMVRRAVDMLRSEGRARTFAAISDPANELFHDRDLYIYVYDLNGVALAHGNNPKMVGKPLIMLKDYEGKLIIQEMVKVAKNKGQGWVDFKWPNPVTKTVESKSGYIERVDDMLIGSGIYK